MKAGYLTSVVALHVGLLLTGCAERATKEFKETAPKKSAPAKEQLAPDTSARVELTPARLKQIESDIAAQKGKIVVLDIWAEFCPPCKEEFPNLVRLSRAHAGDGVVCMSL